MLTKPEERARSISGSMITTREEADEAIARQIRDALKELVEAAREEEDGLPGYDGLIQISTLEKLVNEVLPEEEKIR